MKKSVAAVNPDDYVASLDEVVKWRHLVYLSNGPALLIRAEEERVWFGRWRGQRLRDIEPRLKPGGSTRWRRWSCVKG